MLLFVIGAIHFSDFSSFVLISIMRNLRNDTNFSDTAFFDNFACLRLQQYDSFFITHTLFWEGYHQSRFLIGKLFNLPMRNSIFCLTFNYTLEYIRIKWQFDSHYIVCEAIESSNSKSHKILTLYLIILLFQGVIDQCQTLQKGHQWIALSVPCMKFLINFQKKFQSQNSKYLIF